MKKIKDIPIGDKYLIRVTQNTTRVLKKGKRKMYRVGDYPDIKTAFEAVLTSEVMDLDDKELKLAENGKAMITSLYEGIKGYAEKPINEKLTKSEVDIYALIYSLSKRHKRLTRSYLSHVTNLSDREVRICISNLRKKGYWICSLPDAPGYWLAQNEQDKKDFIAYYTSPAKDIFATMRALESGCPGQIGGLLK